jgi:hypothetical protein
VSLLPRFVDNCIDRTQLFLPGGSLVAKVALAYLVGSLFGCDAPQPEPVAPFGRDGAASSTTRVDSGSSVYPPPPPASTCRPGSVSSFVPVYKQPVGPYANACTTAQLGRFVQDCYASSTAEKDKCDSWLADDANSLVVPGGPLPCASCLTVPASSASGAPLLQPEDGATNVIDEGACIALADPASLPCAQETEYALECELAACVNFCPISAADDAGSNSALTQCLEAAWDAGCSTYDVSKYLTSPTMSGFAKMCLQSLESGAAAFCRRAAEDPNGNSEDLLRYLTLACGPPPLDAGVAGGDGGIYESGAPYDDGTRDSGASEVDDASSDAYAADAQIKSMGP